MNIAMLQTRHEREETSDTDEVLMKSDDQAIKTGVIMCPLALLPSVPVVSPLGAGRAIKHRLLFIASTSYTCCRIAVCGFTYG